MIEENKVEGEAVVGQGTDVNPSAPETNEEVNDASEPSQVDGSDLPEGGEVETDGTAPVEPSPENAPVEETPAANESADSEVPEAPEKVASTGVYDLSNRLVRTYDAETHGEGYHDLAVQFAASEGHTVKEL